jgi:uncharacterized protein (TIGR03435 family)
MIGDVLQTLVCCAVVSFGQSKPPAFEVASVKPHQEPLTRIADFRASGPRLSLEGYSAYYLILEAYRVRSYQLAFASANLPAYDYYDIDAKAEGDGLPTRDEFREMIKTLLAERFKLKIHREMREIPVYELTVDKAGPRLTPASANGECAARIGPVHPEDRNYRYQFTNCTLAPLVDTLQTDRPILDRTELSARYDITMFATPDFRLRNSSEPGDISPLDAVRGLGLKMEPKKDKVEVIVVDHVEKPSEN